MTEIINPELTPEMMEGGRLLFRGPCDFVLGVAGLEQLPNADRTEIAFAGRSNVGKSSLINALTGRNNIARTSNTPGRTQQLNYFSMGEDKTPLYMVDLPGYGYAKVSKSEVQAWTHLLKSYLQGRSSLRRVFVLVDSRHGVKDNDLEIMKMLDVSAVSYQIILTKADKLKKADRPKILEKVKEQAKKLIACHPDIILTSSEKEIGLAEVRSRVFSLTQS